MTDDDIEAFVKRRREERAALLEQMYRVVDGKIVRVGKLVATPHPDGGFVESVVPLKESSK